MSKNELSYGLRQLPYGLKGPLVAASIKREIPEVVDEDHDPVMFVAVITDGKHEVEALRRDVSIEAAAKILSRLVRGTYNGSYCIRPVEM